MRRTKWILGGLLAIALLAVIVSVLLDVMRNRAITVAPWPPRGVDHAVYDDLRSAHQHQPVDWSNLDEALGGLDDFAMAPLMRIVYRHADQVDPAQYEKIHQAILGFRYWMDQPGYDSRCYWSENHQILFASEEYLAGQKYPDEVFTRDNKTGLEHKKMARQRILTWLRQRWLYGFSEWYSNVYYVFDVGPLCNLIDFCDDPDIVAKSTIILDLLFYDVATQMHRGTFVSTMGRAYEHNRKSGEGGNSMRGIIQNIWDFGMPASDGGGMTGAFIFREQYRPPKVIEAIGRDTSPAVIQASQGLDLSELPHEPQSDEDARIMLQWGMEAFSNPEVIENTLDYTDRHGLFSNRFLADLRLLNIRLLRKSGLLPPLMRWIDPVTNGVPLQRANTYTYRTRDYLLACAQHYHPGMLNDQHHVWTATLSNKLSVFAAHPPVQSTKKNAKNDKSNYWVGPGRLPDAVQDKNVCLAIYMIPNKPTYGEEGVNTFTHAYFPRNQFDQAELTDQYAFGRYQTVYVALIGSGPLQCKADSEEELIQPGRETVWICELGTEAEDGTFEAFMQRIRNNPVRYKDGVLTYQTGDRHFELAYQRSFSINGVLQNADYPRHASPYAHTARKADTITIEHGGHRLVLDFEKSIRKEE